MKSFGVVFILLADASVSVYAEGANSVSDANDVSFLQASVELKQPLEVSKGNGGSGSGDPCKLLRSACEGDGDCSAVIAPMVDGGVPPNGDQFALASCKANAQCKAVANCYANAQAPKNAQAPIVLRSTKGEGLNDVGTNSSRQNCAADYGGYVGSPVCCGQPGTISAASHVCGASRPRCTGFVQNVRWGTCQAAPSGQGITTCNYLGGGLAPQDEEECFGHQGGKCGKIDGCPDGQMSASVGSLAHDECCLGCTTGVGCGMPSILIDAALSGGDPFGFASGITDYQPCAYEWRKAWWNSIDHRGWCAEPLDRNTPNYLERTGGYRSWTATNYWGSAVSASHVQVPNVPTRTATSALCGYENTNLDCVGCHSGSSGSIGDSAFCCSGRFKEVHYHWWSGKRWGVCA